jgi:hypothetical protein
VHVCLCNTVQSSSALEALAAAARALCISGKAETLHAHSCVSRILSAEGETPAASPRPCAAKRTLGLLAKAWQAKGLDASSAESQEALQALCALLGSRQGLSNFELEASGAVPALFVYMTAAEVGPGGGQEEEERATEEARHLMDLQVGADPPL